MKRVIFNDKEYTLRQLCKEYGLVEYSVFRKRVASGMPIFSALICPPYMDDISTDFSIVYLYQTGKYTHKEIAELLNLESPRKVSVVINKLNSLNNKDS